MANNSKIEWTDATWNPITGCSIVSPGCTNCYAMRMAARLEAMGQPRYKGLTKPSKAGAVWTGEMRLVDDALTIPLHRKKPTTWFVNSMSDLFHESVPDEWIDRVFTVMAVCPQHTFQVLTKRSARMRSYVAQFAQRGRYVVSDSRSQIGPDLRDGNRFLLLKEKQVWPLRNVWLGVSAEDQRRADERVPDLLATPAAIRFVSAEPLLGPIDFTQISLGMKPGYVLGENGQPDQPEMFKVVRDTLMDTGGDFERLDWIIVGGESGPNARPMQEAWVLSIVEQGRAAGVACFVKQLSGPKGRAVKDIAAFPAVLQVREMPHAA